MNDRPCTSFINDTVEMIRILPSDAADSADDTLEQEVDGFVDRNLTAEEKRAVVSYYEDKHLAGLDLGVVFGQPSRSTCRSIIATVDGMISGAACELLKAEIRARLKKAGIA